MKKLFNEGNQVHNFMSSSGSGTVINYGSGSGSDFLTSYGSGSTSLKVMVPTVPVPVPHHCSLHTASWNFVRDRVTWLAAKVELMFCTTFAASCVVFGKANHAGEIENRKCLQPHRAGGRVAAEFWNFVGDLGDLLGSASGSSDGVRRFDS